MPLRRDRSFPSSVFGPVDFWALARLARSCLSETSFFAISVLIRSVSESVCSSDGLNDISFASAKKVPCGGGAGGFLLRKLLNSGGRNIENNGERKRLFRLSG